MEEIDQMIDKFIEEDVKPVYESQPVEEPQSNDDWEDGSNSLPF